MFGHSNIQSAPFSPENSRSSLNYNIAKKHTAPKHDVLPCVTFDTKSFLAFRVYNKEKLLNVVSPLRLQFLILRISSTNFMNRIFNRNCVRGNISSKILKTNW